MELKRRFNWRRCFTILYVVAFVVYVVIGLHPVEAKNYEISGKIVIPSIELSSDVTTLELVDHRLDTPDTIVGSFSKYSSKVFLIGHSSTVFKNLKDVKINDFIYYNGGSYRITKLETLAKGDVDMNMLLAPAKESTIVIMTCAGEALNNNDATHRLIVTAVKVS